MSSQKKTPIINILAIVTICALFPAGFSFSKRMATETEEGEKGRRGNEEAHYQLSIAHYPLAFRELFLKDNE